MMIKPFAHSFIHSFIHSLAGWLVGWLVGMIRRNRRLDGQCPISQHAPGSGTRARGLRGGVRVGAEEQRPVRPSWLRGRVANQCMYPLARHRYRRRGCSRHLPPLLLRGGAVCCDALLAMGLLPRHLRPPRLYTAEHSRVLLEACAARHDQSVVQPR